MKLKIGKTRRRMRLPSMKSIRQGAASFYQAAKESGKRVMRSLRRLTQRITCRRR